MSFQPKITVLISTFNDRDYIAKKTAEIEAQTAFKDAEFLFLETGSPERERELLEPYCEQHPNCRLVTRDERLTLYEAWNLGWSEASAPLVCISNMDDAMHPRLLEITIEQMSTHDWDLGSVLIAKQKLEDPKRDNWAPKRLKPLALQPRPGAFFAWKRELASSFGNFDTTFQIAGDKDFWARAVAKKLKLGLIPQVLYLYTQHPNQLSKSERYRSLKEADRQHAASKAYPHIWPDRLIRKVRWTEKLGKLPIPRLQKHFIPIEDE